MQNHPLTRSLLLAIPVFAFWTFLAFTPQIQPVPGTVIFGGGLITAFLMLVTSILPAPLPPLLLEALRAATAGNKPPPASNASIELRFVLDEIGRLAGSIDSSSAETEKARDKAHSAESELSKMRAEIGRLSADNGRLASDNAQMQSELRMTKESGGTISGRKRGELDESVGRLEEIARKLTEMAVSEVGLSQDTSRKLRELNDSLRQIATSVESLAQTAEDSSSSVLQLTTTNDQVAENIGELTTSVRETVSSIEEMTYSIKEVAKNVDALSLTAEETSSSMNEMDVSIDQVQTNANETAKLSEEVATDAEHGAESILKTIGEIYRIKETSQEAVDVISKLGDRIEAIGQILTVIDDVAEQTNLLALNAAIIAAQAGEHGKGFAVVADEIKDLAERAGASTKEIADLIKTIQAESKNAVAAVERGAHNVDRGVEVSNEAERALKKILESSQKSTGMVRAIARATVEQAKGSKQVTDAIGRIAETVQQIAAATAQQARGSELIVKSAEKMRGVSQHVERNYQEQAKGSRQIAHSIENITAMISQLHQSHRAQSKSTDSLLAYSEQFDAFSRNQETAGRQLTAQLERVRRLFES